MTGVAWRSKIARMRVETFAQQLFFCTSLIQTSATAGTGFVWMAESGPHQVPVLVTNKHVALTPGPGSFSLAAREPSGAPKLGERVSLAHPDLASAWTGHPNPEVDVAAMFLAPFFSAAESAGKLLFFRAVTEDICPSEEVVDADLDAIEPVVFVGYPNALFDKSNLTPIARRGYTATPVALDYNGLPSFLIDASVFPGSSGSPVFISQDNGYRSGSTMHLAASRILFVGLVAAVHIQQDTGRLVTSVPQAHVQLNQLMDLGIVYNWRAVRETVQGLFAAHDLPYGAVPPVQTGLEDAARVEVATQVEPPDRPGGAPAS